MQNIAADILNSPIARELSRSSRLRYPCTLLLLEPQWHSGTGGIPVSQRVQAAVFTQILTLVEAKVRCYDPLCLFHNQLVFALVQVDITRAHLIAKRITDFLHTHIDAPLRIDATLVEHNVDKGSIAASVNELLWKKQIKKVAPENDWPGKGAGVLACNLEGLSVVQIVPLLPLEVMRRISCAVIGSHRQFATVVLADPTNKVVLEELATATRYTLFPIYASQSAIEAFLDRVENYWQANPQAAPEQSRLKVPSSLRSKGVRKCEKM